MRPAIGLAGLGLGQGVGGRGSGELPGDATNDTRAITTEELLPAWTMEFRSLPCPEDTLDSTRVSSNSGRIAEEIITHLTGIEGADVAVTLEIQAVVPKGIEQAIVRAVTENCRTLNFSSHGFERG